MKFNERLKILRKEKNYSQNEIANLVGKTQQAYSKYEAGLAEPNNETLQKLADLLNVTTDYLMCYTDKNLKEKNTDINKLTLIGRNGKYSEFILTDEEMEAYEKIFQNRDKIRENNKGKF